MVCHTDMYHYQAWKQIADELGIYFDEEINNRLRGVSRMESFEIILERYEGTMSLEDKVVYTTRKNEAYKELLKNMSPADLSPEVKETLDGLRAKGLKRAIGSSSKNAGFSLERLGLDGYFEAVSDEITLQDQAGSGSICKSRTACGRSFRRLSGRGRRKGWSGSCDRRRHGLCRNG